MHVQKAILVELAAILVVLYGGFLNMGIASIAVTTFGLLIGLFAAVQGFFSDTTSPNQGTVSTETESKDVREKTTEWIAGIFLLAVITVAAVGGSMAGGSLGMPYGRYIGGASGAILAFAGVAWGYYGR